MKQAIKGALMSALVFPGLGQILLKRYLRGAVFISLICVLFVLLVVEAEKVSMAILQDMQSTGVEVTQETIVDAAREAFAAPESLVIKVVFYLIVFCWLISIADAYYIGRKVDQRGSCKPSKL